MPALRQQPTAEQLVDGLPESRHRPELGLQPAHTPDFRIDTAGKAYICRCGVRLARPPRASVIASHGPSSLQVVHAHFAAIVP